mmetsp:Transcript_23922/g.40393  ORF Transcript_23922/g.40393 Transcript_23922/m.40393 type:complete len:228 (+) Transcript_23922:3808-4491(+)
MRMHIDSVIVAVPEPMHDVVGVRALSTGHWHADDVGIARHMRNMRVSHRPDDPWVLWIVVYNVAILLPKIALPPMQGSGGILGVIAKVGVRWLHCPGEIRCVLACSAVATPVQSRLSSCLIGRCGSAVDVVLHPVLVLILPYVVLVVAVDDYKVGVAAVARRPFDGHLLPGPQLSVHVGGSTLAEGIRRRRLEHCPPGTTEPVMRRCGARLQEEGRSCCQRRGRTPK